MAPDYMKVQSTLCMILSSMLIMKTTTTIQAAPNRSEV